MTRQALAAFASGGLFGAGLGLSGMTNPRTVLAFLDVFGDWDPTLAFMMAGAIGVHALLYRLILRRPTPLLAPRFLIPSRREIDAPLVAGTALFGVGFGLAGYCAGPALVSLSAGLAPAALFVGAMLGGMGLYELTQRGGRPRVAPRAEAAR